MSYLNWHVGMKVVCVKKGAWSPSTPGESHPVYGGVYTIRTIECPDGDVFLRFAEIINPKARRDIYGSQSESQYWATRFRPLFTRKTDISIFTAMLHGTDQTVDA